MRKQHLESEDDIDDGEDDEVEVVLRKEQASSKLTICKRAPFQLRRALPTLSGIPHPPRDGELCLSPREWDAPNAFLFQQICAMGAVPPMPPAFNRYSHHSLCIVRKEMDEDPTIITCKEGFIQGCCLYSLFMACPWRNG